MENAQIEVRKGRGLHRSWTWLAAGLALGLAAGITGSARADESDDDDDDEDAPTQKASSPPRGFQGIALASTPLASRSVPDNRARPLVEGVGGSAPMHRGARLVGVALSSGQALVWDESAEGGAEYRLLKLGDAFAGGHIAGIAADRVYVEREGGGEEIAISAAPALRVPAGRPGRPARPPATLVLGEEPTRSEQAMPVSATSSPSLAPAPPAPPALAFAPMPTPTTYASVAPRPVPVAPTPPPVYAPMPAAAPAPVEAADPGLTAPRPPEPPVPPSRSEAPRDPLEPISLRRADFDERLGNFDALSSDVAIQAVPGTGYRVSAVRPGSYIEHLGVRAGDVVLAIDGRPILTPDDAARAYAWLRLTDRFTVDVLRAGTHLTLRYAVGA